MQPFQFDYNTQYSPYRAFQGSGNTIVDLALSMLSTGGSFNDPLGGSVNSNFLNFHSQLSAYNNDQMFRQMFTQGAVALSGQQNMMQTGIQMMQQVGGQPFTPAQQLAMQNTIQGIGPLALPIFNSPMARNFLDVAFGGAAASNAFAAVGLNYEHFNDPITGARKLSALSGSVMADSMFQHLFQNPDAVGGNNFYGAGAAALQPSLRYLGLRGKFSTQNERQILDEETRLNLMFPSSFEAQDREIDRLERLGFNRDILQEYAESAGASTAELEDLDRRSSGIRLAESSKSLRNVANAMREVLGPDGVLMEFDQILQHLDSFTQNWGQSFSHNEVSSIMRQVDSSLRRGGMSFTQQSMVYQAAQIGALQQGYHGAMGGLTLPYASASYHNLRTSGAFEATGYGMLDQNEMLARSIGDQLAYGNSEEANMMAAMLYYVDNFGDQLEGTNGDRLRRIMSDIQRYGISRDEEWNNMDVFQRQALLESASRDPSITQTLHSFAGNRLLTEAILGDNPNIMRGGIHSQRNEFEYTTSQVAFDEALYSAGVNLTGDQADQLQQAMSSILMGMSPAELSTVSGSVDNLVARLRNSGQFDHLSDSELRRLSSGYLAAVRAETGQLNLGNLVNTIGDDAVAGADATMEMQDIEANLREMSSGMANNSVTDFLRGLSKAFIENGGDPSKFREIANAALKNAGIGDQETQEKLSRIVDWLADESDQVTRELIEAEMDPNADERYLSRLRARQQILNKYMEDFGSIEDMKLAAVEEEEAKRTEKELEKDSIDGGSPKQAVFNNLVMNFPNDIQITVGEVKAESSHVKEALEIN